MFSGDVGFATVRGTEALRSYWLARLSKVDSLLFTLQRILWDADGRELAIVYVSTIDGAVKSASENLRFGSDGKVVAAQVFHGATSRTSARPAPP